MLSVASSCHYNRNSKNRKNRFRQMPAPQELSQQILSPWTKARMQKPQGGGKFLVQIPGGVSVCVCVCGGGGGGGGGWLWIKLIPVLCCPNLVTRHDLLWWQNLEPLSYLFLYWICCHYTPYTPVASLLCCDWSVAILLLFTAISFRTV